MSEEILISVSPQETRVAIVLDGVVQELHIERTQHLGLVGNVYIGQVRRVLPGMQSAFVDIGLDRAAFLRTADIPEHQHNGDDNPPIENILFEGQSLIVQVVKDPTGTKGARLSTQISFAGRLLVYLPQEPHINVSRRIEGEAERLVLREKLQQLLPGDEKGGYIIRTMAEAASDRELSSDVEYLKGLWGEIQERYKNGGAPTLLYQDLNLSLRVLRDFLHDETERIFFDNRDTLEIAQAFARNYMCGVINRLHHYSGERALFDLYGVEDEIERALGRHVNLNSGGYLIIDQTEALTTIDVNTGSFVGGRTFDDTIFKTNSEAAIAIARQLRLRNLAGIIVIDFISMDNKEHRDAVLSELKKSIVPDRTHITVSGYSSLGLVEMTRARARASLAHVLCEPCTACRGNGQLKTAQTVCYQILRELAREARQFNAREYRILASQAVIDLFLDEESQNLAQLAGVIGKPVSLQMESQYTQNQFNIVLM